MEKIKPKITYWLDSEKGKDIMVVVIVILVGLGSFELGRLSKQNTSSGIQIEYTDQNSNQQASIFSSLASSSVLPARNASRNDAGGQKTRIDNSGKNFFASSKGSKYYSMGCSAGKSIKQENRVYFATREAAEGAGYTLASGCK